MSPRLFVAMSDLAREETLALLSLARSLEAGEIDGTTGLPEDGHDLR